MVKAVELAGLQCDSEPQLKKDTPKERPKHVKSNHAFQQPSAPHTAQEILKYLYNLLKIDKPNHRRGRDKGHITPAKIMWQLNRRQRRREREESMQRSAQKKRLGERPAEDPEEPAQRQSKATSGKKTWVERDKRQPAGSPPDLDHSRKSKSEKEFRGFLALQQLISRLIQKLKSI